MPAITPRPGWLRRLAGHCLRHRGQLAVVVASTLLAALVSAAVPVVVRQVVDGALGAGPGRPGVLGWLGPLLGLAGLGYGAGLLSRYSAGRLALDVAHDIRADAFRALTRMDGGGQDDADTGQLVSRTVTDLSLIQGMLASVPVLVGNGLLFLLAFAVMATLSPALTLLAGVMGPALWYVAERSRRRLFAVSSAAQQSAGEVAGAVEAAVAGVLIVKGFGQEQREVGEVRRRARRLFAARMRLVRTQSRYGAMLQTIPLLWQGGVLLLGGWLALHGRITLGTFLAFSVYLAQLVAPLRRLTALLTVVQRARAGAERVLDIIDTRPAVTDPADPVPLPGTPLDVEFRGVHFGYPGGPPVLDGLCLRVPAGQTVAVVGPTGSGKSTIGLLLARLHDPETGQIRLGGTDIRRTSLAELRSRVGVTFEDSLLFAGTIRANIGYARPGATQEQIRAAATAAGAHEFIAALPDGYDTVVGERGGTLSGGQRQRIALARALLPEPSVLVLDDTTAAVDPLTAADIHAALRLGGSGRTTILIARQYATVRLADRVVVLDRGRVADSGPVDAVAARCPLLRALRPASLAGPPTGVPGPDPRAAGATGPGVARAEPPRAQSGADQPGIPDALALPATGGIGLGALLRPVRGPVAAGLALLCLDTAGQLAVPTLVRLGVDRGVLAGSSGTLLALSAAVLVVAGAGGVANRLSLLTNGRTGERLLYLLRLRTFAHLQRLGLDYYEREPAGRIMTRMTTDVDALADFLQTGLPLALVSLLTLAGVLTALVLLDLGMSLVLVATLPLIWLATRLMRTRALPAYTAARERMGQLTTWFHESVTGLRVVQVCGRVDDHRSRYLAASRAYRNARLRAHLLICAYLQFIALLSDLARAAVLVIGLARLGGGGPSAGVLIAFVLYLDVFFAPVQQLTQVVDGHRQARVSLDRLDELLRTPTSVPDTGTVRPPGRLAGQVRLRGVRFSYPGSAVEALSGVDLVVPAGHTVALVGRTGAGKSTVVKLIARCYDPTAGAVLVDGHDLRTLTLRGYRCRLGVVPQEAYLCAGSVRDAIAYGRPEASDAEVVAAARAVGAHGVIVALPGGYQHQVGERGRGLSAGQRQLVALARAHLVAPDILLLDEATSALDPATEAAVQAAMARLARDRTTILIAHRLATAAWADQIVVLDHGRIVQAGRHDDLLAAGGPYARLWAASGSGPGAAHGDRHQEAGWAIPRS